MTRIRSFAFAQSSLRFTLALGFMGKATVHPKLTMASRLKHPADPSLRRPLVMGKATLITELAGAGLAKEITNFFLCNLRIMREATVGAELARASAMKELAGVRLLRVGI